MYPKTSFSKKQLFFIKRFNPLTKGLRFKVALSKNLLSKSDFVKSQIKCFYKKKVGKNTNNGLTTSWHKSCFIKKLYRNINLKQTNSYKNGIVLNIIFDPMRSTFISLNFDVYFKKFFYRMATHFHGVGSVFKNSSTFNDEITLGSRSQIKNLPIGSVINNLTLDNTNIAKYIRAAGTFGTILRCDKYSTQIKLPSKKIIEISPTMFATIGQSSNIWNNLVVLGKAGANRLLGHRPIVRGIAMNPVDHPHGGRSNGGKHSCTPWGLPTKSGFYLRKKK